MDTPIYEHKSGIAKTIEIRICSDIQEHTENPHNVHVILELRALFLIFFIFFFRK